MKKWIGYEKGVNLGGWLSQCDYSKERLEHFIEEEDIKRLSTWGLDHLRLPMDYNVLREENGTFKKDGFDYVKRAVEWCCKYGLNVILDLHKTAGYSFDKGEQEHGFLQRRAIRNISIHCGRKLPGNLPDMEIRLPLNFSMR